MKNITNNKLQITLLTALLLLNCTTVHAAKTGTLKFHGEVEVSNKKVLLSDLVINQDELTEEQLKFEVIQAPSLGGKTNHTLISLAYKLQKFPSIYYMRISGPDRITVTHKIDKKRIKKLTDKVRKSLKNQLPWNAWTLKVKFQLSDERKLASVGEFDRVELKPTANRRLLGSVNMDATFYDKDDNEIHECTITPTIQKKIQVVMMVDSQPSGHTLNRHDLQLADYWVGGENMKYLTKLKDCIGKELTHHMEAGDMPRAAQMLEAKCAKRGDLVYVTCNYGNLTVRISATAEQPGRKGDTITVRNKTSNKILRVELTGLKNAVMKI